jgi:hypothetical protein
MVAMSDGQPLPSQDFCGTAALPPETGHRSARLARQKSASNGPPNTGSSKAAGLGGASGLNVASDMAS